MAPKTSKGKGVAKDAGAKEPPESELAARQTQSTYFPTSRVECTTWRAVRDMGGMRGASAACRRHVTVNGKEAARAFPI